MTSEMTLTNVLDPGVRARLKCLAQSGLQRALDKIRSKKGEEREVARFVERNLAATLDLLKRC